MCGDGWDIKQPLPSYNLGTGNRENDPLDWSDQGRFCRGRSGTTGSLVTMNASGLREGKATKSPKTPLGLS